MDGSNIATEGRAAPSLQQLDEAVRALLAEYGYEHVTVVVDATFGHRINAKELAAYEEAVLNGELVTPPAGAIGRGDAFVLQIADRAGADVFSNDSFQEFHGAYSWLFDEGRLIGGKPVTNVGWVFVLRAPVRGPASRRSMRDARKTTKRPAAPLTPMTPPAKAGRAAKTGTRGTAATETPAKAAKSSTRASKATSKKAAAAPGATKAKKAATPTKATKASLAVAVATEEAEAANAGSRPRRRRSSASREPINDQLVYLSFVVDHPIDTVVEGTVDRFASHGAYVHVGDAQCYVPLRELGDPPPRSAREVLNLGETRPFVVHRFDPVRRGIDVLPTTEGVAMTESGSSVAKAVASATGSTNQTPHAEEAHVSPAAKKAPARRKKAAAKKAPARKKKAAAKRAPARKKSTARKSTARKSTARKSTARKSTKKAAKKRAPARRKKAAAKKAPARKKKATTRKKAPARKKAAAKRGTARKSTAKKATRKKATARRRTAKKTTRKR